MKQFFNTTKENEPLSISLEEEALFISEMQDVENETQTAFDEVARLADVQQGVEDVREINAATSEPTGVEAQLTDVVAEMAVAGTDSDATELFAPVTEDVLVTEGFMDKAVSTLKAIWEAIKAAIEKAKEQVKKFFKSMHLFLSPTKRRLERAKKEEEDRLELQRTMDKLARERMEKERERNRRTRFPFHGKVSRLIAGSVVPTTLPQDLHNLNLWAQSKLMDYNSHMLPVAELLEKNSKEAVNSMDRFSFDTFIEIYWTMLEKSLHVSGIPPGEDQDRNNRLGGLAIKYYLSKSYTDSYKELDTSKKLSRLKDFNIGVSCHDEASYGPRDLPVLTDPAKKTIMDVARDWTEFLDKNASSFYTEKLDKTTEKIKSNINAIITNDLKNEYGHDRKVKDNVNGLM